jgi:polyisoprenyl-phosphate glycosyltransferase
MNNTFLTVVVVAQNGYEIRKLSYLLSQVSGVLVANFRDFEIVVINNTTEALPQSEIKTLLEEYRQHIYFLQLSTPVLKNHAILAGLDRSNGDYTVIFEYDFIENPRIILELYQKSQEQFDIVYCKANSRNARGESFFYSIFYFILHKYSDLQVDKWAHNTRIISRRALNSLLRLRENLRYMKAIYSIVGYKNGFIEVKEPLNTSETESFSDRFGTSMVAITSFTNFLNNLLLSIFLFSVFFTSVVIFNALKVKFTNYDIFGDFHNAIGGWTFLVIIMSIFFATTCLTLYIMSIYLSNIYNEIKQRPLYIIESTKKI